MSRSPFVGSGRLQEGGKSAVHKQDFNAHITGGGFNHQADQINMNPPIPGFNNIFTDTSVQGTIEKITSILELAGSGFISISDGYGTGDFTIGDPGVPNVESAFAQAFASPRLVNGGVVLVKAGTYVITSRVVVPSGITILGEGKGTILIGHMGEQPIFHVSKGIQRPDIGGSLTLDAGAPLDGVRFIDLVISDNLDGYIKAGGVNTPTMQTVPMIECEIGSKVECEQVTFIGHINLNFPTLTITKCAIGYSSGSATGTTLIMHRCYFDGLGIGISFNPGSGIQDFLTVTNCRARINGVPTDLVTKSNNCFIAFTLCNANLCNNYVNYNGSGSNSVCFDQLSSTVIGNYPKVIIMGNSGGVNAGVGNLIGDFTEQMHSIISNNSYGSDYNNSWYITVGTGTSSADNGDINGIYALESVLNNLGGLSTNVNYIYVKGTGHIIRRSPATSGAILIGIKRGKVHPTVLLDLSLTSVVDTISRKTLVIGRYIKDIEFISSGTGFKSLSLSWDSGTLASGTVGVEGCYFKDSGLVTKTPLSINSISDDTGSPSKWGINLVDTGFHQTNTYAESASLCIPEVNIVNLKRCYFTGRGYAGIIGTIGSVYSGFAFPGSLPTQKSNQIIIEDCEFDTTNYTISIDSPFLINSYFIINSVTASVNIKNTKLLCDNTFNQSGATGISVSCSSWFYLHAKNVNIENCIFNGPSITFSSSGIFATATLLADGLENLYINNSRFLLGALPLKVINNNVSNSLQGIAIRNSQFESTAMCALAIDVDGYAASVIFDHNSSQPKIIIEGCNFKNNMALGSQKIQNEINTGSYNNAIGIVQVYASNVEVTVNNNSIDGSLVLPGTLGSPYMGVCGLVVDNYNSTTAGYTGLYVSAAKISQNTIQAINNFENADTGSFALAALVRSCYLNVVDNTLGLLNKSNSIAPPTSNYTSLLWLDNNPLTNSGTGPDSSGIVMGNNFQRLKSGGVVSKLKRAAIVVGSSSNSGQIVRNHFSSPFLRDDSSASDINLLADLSSTANKWIFECNKNQTSTYSLSAVRVTSENQGPGVGNFMTSHSVFGTNDGNISFSAPGFNAVNSDTNLFWFNYPGSTSAVDGYFIVDLQNILPYGTKLISVNYIARSTVVHTGNLKTVITNSTISSSQNTNVLFTSGSGYIANSDRVITLTVSSPENWVVNGTVAPMLYISPHTANITGTSGRIELDTINIVYRW